MNSSLSSVRCALCVGAGVLLLGLGGCNLKINMSPQENLQNVAIALGTPAVGSQPKQVALSWSVSGSGASDVTRYTLLVRPSSADDFQSVTMTVTSGTTYSANVVLPALHTYNWSQAVVKIRGCNASAACVDSAEQKLVSVLPGIVGYAKPTVTAPTGARYGWSVAVSSDGNTLAIGAPYEASASTGINGVQTDATAASAGAVYVYVRSGANWSFQAYVKASNTGSKDLFGSAVALSADGNTLVVGAPGEASANVNNPQDNSMADAGAVYVFDRGSAAWSQLQYLKASTPKPASGFGAHLALSGDGTTLAVGATGESSSATGINGNQDNTGSLHAGAVYVFAMTNKTWSQQAYVKASFHQTATTVYGDWFGQSVALSSDGNTMAVGASGESTGTNQTLGTGYVFVFARTGTTWAEQKNMQAATPIAGAGFGSSVALSADGNNLVVGAPNEQSATGAVYPFVRSNSVWTALTALRPATARGSLLGSSVAISPDGTVLVAGAPGDSSNVTGVSGAVSTDTSASKAGAAYVYTVVSGAWALRSYVKAPRYAVAGNLFGASLGLSNEGALVVGATGESSSTINLSINGDQSNTASSDAGAAFLF